LRIMSVTLKQPNKFRRRHPAGANCGHEGISQKRKTNETNHQLYRYL
jgi:hypothetical protein